VRDRLPRLCPCRAAAAEAVRPPRTSARPAAALRALDAHARPAAGGVADVPGALEGSPLAWRGSHEGARMTARADFLARIRREVAKAPGQFAASPVSRPPHPGAAAEAIRRELTERWPQALERFREEFERIAGVFHRVPTLEAVPSVIAVIARERGASRLVTWDAAALGFDPGPALSRDVLPGAAVRAGQEDDAARERHRAEAAAAQIGVTGADFVLAETGTLILL